MVYIINFILTTVICTTVFIIFKHRNKNESVEALTEEENEEVLSDDTIFYVDVTINNFCTYSDLIGSKEVIFFNMGSIPFLKEREYVLRIVCTENENLNVDNILVMVEDYNIKYDVIKNGSSIDIIFDKMNMISFTKGHIVKVIYIN